ncbi:NAD(P)-dependent oxidoreductase [Vitreoscilla massiliensis]|uniref:NAD(P)-dependent oxidoreductase n=1 Tax=Vitreoscilla massiliensis TaxID=1689272 RepID=A0ABY4E5D3_9NEIS|nr:NAD(P)-dependent oxidoreductase [Vitreoscilla massiliensis]UOO90514.1 NAD(P)-dependent oxidoreductase [Vitreoscilla massiliensis]
MKIAIIAASGKQGQALLNEALARNLDVTAIVRDASKISQDVPVIEKDALALSRDDVAPFDVIINAFGAPSELSHLHVAVGQHLIALLQHSATRLLVVGGAGSLFVNPEHTVRLIDTPEFPDIYKPTASNQAQNLQDLQAASDLNWAFLSPAAFFDAEGKRSGAYQLGSEELIVNQAGNSYVSYADYAIALIDEALQPQHRNQRFSVVAEAA